ncbi:MAG: hypothetical protein K1000chlam2_01217 [Chlamydiae bacterium]|nr:hypothetical protein [Chlamydiota bacterium]
MLIKSLVLFLLLFSSIAHSQELHCTPELKKVVERIEQLPEGKELIDRVLEEGDLHIVINQIYSKKFEGYWDASIRTIHVTKTPSDSAFISTILFELHNALRESDFEKTDQMAYQGSLDRNGYVKAMEHIEYENARATSNLLNKGIELGLFPYDSYWEVSDTFEEHFLVQKQAGHAAWFAKMYDQL